MLNVAKCTRDQCSIFSTVQKFHSDHGPLLELHALTLVTLTYALLNCTNDKKRLLQARKAGQSPGNDDEVSILLYTIEKRLTA